MPSDPRALLRWLLALVLLVVPAWCLWQALELVFTLFGESPTAAEQQAAARWTTAAVVVALVASLGGVLLSAGRRGAAWGFGTALVLSCALAVAATSSVRQVVPEPEPPGRSRGACQEHSGGPTTCPGG